MLRFPCPSSPKWWLAAMLSGGFVCELLLFARLAVTEEEIQGGEEAGKGKSHWSGPFVLNPHCRSFPMVCFSTFCLCCDLTVLK